MIIFYEIPYKLDYYSKFSELHKDNFHCFFRRLIDIFIYSGYIYKGLYEDAQTILKICPVFIQKERQYYKREPSCQIIFNKPKERYIGDIFSFLLSNNPKNILVLYKRLFF